jgi:hypothetical protein
MCSIQIVCGINNWMDQGTGEINYMYYKITKTRWIIEVQQRLRQVENIASN